MRTRKKLTAPMAARIKKLAQAKTMDQQEIAAVVGCNQGRVSEVLSGKRFAQVALAE